MTQNPGWTSWSGRVTCAPQRMLSPASEEEVGAAVAAARADGLGVRVAGTGHSFTPIVASDGVLLTLANLAGLESVDEDAGLATIRAGTTIHDLAPLIHSRGLAMENMGDVDVQVIAGAVSTGTHGTGPSLGNISTQVAAIRLVDGTGAVRTIDDGDDLRAARVAVGSLGVITAVTLRCVPAYDLHERQWVEPGDETLAKLAERIAATRHYEFFWLPREDLSACKSLHPTTEAPASVEGREGQRIGPWHEIIPSIRNDKFNEMEYSVPAEAGPSCFEDLRRLMRESHPQIRWPVEYRTLRADDAMLSTASGRDTVTISIHEAADRDPDAFFADAEKVFLAHDGRPHWGKLHNLRSSDLAPRYPRWADFQAVRRRFDPEGLFVNDHLQATFGAARTS